ncbi:MAG: S1 RNA-binding domain-containing protein, partial [Opitutaceae bacterium]|nr:S1 RNA-binding domain-containing protein [Opitutaceae bacterium]
ADDAGTAAPAATPPPPPAPAPEKHPPETAEEKPAEISPPPETPDLDTVTKLLDDAYAQAANDCGEDVTLAMLKSIMIQIDPTFDTANYGYKGPESLQKLIEAVGGYKMIDPHRIRKIKPAAHHKFSAATLEKYKEGSVVKGKINHIAPIGILVFLEPGVTGIINTPNISWELPPPAYNLGDEVEAKVIAITAEPQRVVLSIKHLINNPWESFLEKYKEGDEVNGRIIDMNSFNVLIRLEEGITGIVHVSNISWEYVGHPADELKIGQKTKARILAIEPKMQRVSLSIKHLAEDPWERIHYEYHIGDTVRCTVTGQDRYNAGCFARIKKGLIAYIPQMNLTEPLIPGQQIEAAITLIDTSRRKLHLKPKPGLQNRLDL